jgi:hypothetical protein
MAELKELKSAITTEKALDLEAQIHKPTPYEKRLFNYNENCNEDQPRFLIFRSLQRLNIVDIQNRLSDYNHNIWQANQHAPKTDREREQLSKTLRDYGT